MLYHITDIIAKKRDGGTLSDAEIDYFVRGTADGTITDYQLSALLMAMYIRGMSLAETTALTTYMAHSGDIIDLERFGTLTADKHSTGGVGDKTTLIVAPAAAACGLTVAKMSGRALGHTGGTIDKLEAIPGFRTSLSPEEFMRCVRENSLALAGQTGSLAPADKKLYALRDTTATVDSIPLIAASIMSKKIASGAHNIVLDVKCGSGAFMKSPETAHELAMLMTQFGHANGRNTAALITDMSIPLGRAIGNAIEVEEALFVLRGGYSAGLCELCEALAGAMVSISFGVSFEEGRRRAAAVIADGGAYRKFVDMTRAQGCKQNIEDGVVLISPDECETLLCAEHEGWVNTLDALLCGEAAMRLGAGRATQESRIDLSAGIYLDKKPGEYVKCGDVLAHMYHGQTLGAQAIAEARELLMSAYTYADTPPSATPLIIDTIGI